MPALVRSRQIQIGIWRGARFLNNAMQQNHSLLLIDIEEHARDSIPWQICSDFVYSFTYRAAGRHSNRPSEFDSLDIFTDQAPVFRIHCLEPFAAPAHSQQECDKRRRERASRLLN
jgi:hypothetical protein